MLKRKEPMKRGNSQMRRSRLAPIGKRKKRRVKTVDQLKAIYFKTHGWKENGQQVTRCQACGELMTSADCKLHHKTLVSQGGPDAPENLVALHNKSCHLAFIHDGGMGLSGPEARARIETVKASLANLNNGFGISWSNLQRAELANIRRSAQCA